MATATPPQLERDSHGDHATWLFEGKWYPEERTPVWELLAGETPVAAYPDPPEGYRGFHRKPWWRRK